MGLLMARISMQFVDHDTDQSVSLEVDGDGSIEFFFETFRSFLMAAGIHEDELEELGAEIAEGSHRWSEEGE